MYSEKMREAQQRQLAAALERSMQVREKKETWKVPAAGRGCRDR